MFCPPQVEIKPIKTNYAETGARDANANQKLQMF